jgi:hypothetical protein
MSKPASRRASPKAALGMLLILSFLGAGMGQDKKDTSPPGDQSAPSTVPVQLRNVTITPIRDGPDAGKLRLQGDIGQGVRPIIPALPRVGARAKVTDGKLTRIVDLGREAFQEGQKQYLSDLEKAKKLVFLHDRGLIRRDVKGPPVRPTGEQEQGGMLVPLQGLPALPPAEEEMIRKNCLMITDLKVVEDDRAKGAGPWTFGHLMKQLANEPVTGIPASAFVRKWLSTWEKDKTINSFTAPHRRKGIRELIIGGLAAAAPARPASCSAPSTAPTAINRCLSPSSSSSASRRAVSTT